MNPPRILAVDDEYANRFILQNILTQYDLVLAESAEEMWEYLETTTEPPDLILLDVMMPRESGFDAARRLAEDERYRDIPVVFLTARVSGEDVAQGFELGGQDYIKKPFEESELLARIGAVLRRKKHQQSLREGATIDALTGASRRETFLENAHARLQFAQRKGTPFALVLIDLDDFKQTNDTHGHQAGDAVLSQVGSILRSELREYDLFGRYGGEEFALALLEEDKESAGELVERLRRKLEKSTVRQDQTELRVTASIGVADSVEGTGSPSLEALIELADERLYRAKERGKNQVCLD